MLWIGGIMTCEEPASERAFAMSKRWSLRKRVAVLVGALVLAYLGVAYLILPVAWERYAHKHPSLEDIPNITYTADKIPGDPLNVALIGTETQVKKILLAAKWYPAAPIFLRHRQAGQPVRPGGWRTRRACRPMAQKDRSRCAVVLRWQMPPCSNVPTMTRL